MGSTSNVFKGIHMIIYLFVLFLTYDLSATLLENSAEQKNPTAQILTETEEELACTIPLQTLKMARSLMHERVNYLSTLSEDELVAQSSTEELILYRQSLQTQKHDVSEKQRHSCPQMMFSSLTVGSCLFVCGGLAIAKASMVVVGGGCCLISSLCGAAVYEEPDHTEINAIIKKADAAYARKQSFQS